MLHAINERTERKPMEKKQKISDITAQARSIPVEELLDFIACYREDERIGVKKAVERAEIRRKAFLAEKDRIQAMKDFEHGFGEYQYYCGTDEAGRGPLAGPVVAAAVILPADSEILYVNDSKKLSEKQREELFVTIQQEALSWAVGIASCQRIDEINILQADYEALRQAVNQLKPAPEILLNDALIIPDLPFVQKSIIKGDAKCYCIAAASILAKVTRDHLMEQYDKEYPEYGFAKHKGYGTKEHIEALQKYGPCPIHRRTFIKKVML